MLGQRLGIAKLLGVVAVLAPDFPKLKEWAYAGFTFLLVGAAYSHAAAGDPVQLIVIPLVVLGVGLISYKLRPRTRRILETQLSGAWTD
ncbi:MAG: DoxX family protein [bacterium]|nr:DoxX family protein [bacterium]